jgi:hypothetical protein
MVGMGYVWLLMDLAVFRSFQTSSRLFLRVAIEQKGTHALMVIWQQYVRGVGADDLSMGKLLRVTLQDALRGGCYREETGCSLPGCSS